MGHRYPPGEVPRYELISNVARVVAARLASAPWCSGVEVRRVVLAGARAALDGGRGDGDEGTDLAAAAFDAALAAARLDAGDPVVRELVVAAVRSGVSVAAGPRGRPPLPLVRGRVTGGGTDSGPPGQPPPAGRPLAEEGPVQRQ